MREQGAELLPIAMLPLCETGAELLSMPALLEPEVGLLSMPPLHEQGAELLSMPALLQQGVQGYSRCLQCVSRKLRLSRCLP